MRSKHDLEAAREDFKRFFKELKIEMVSDPSMSSCRWYMIFSLAGEEIHRVEIASEDYSSDGIMISSNRRLK